MANLNSLTDPVDQGNNVSRRLRLARSEYEKKRLYLGAKRVIDFIVSLGLLILLAPVMFIIAILIKLDSPGPTVFTQERMGYDWRYGKLRTFTFCKFRSMVRNADQSIHQQHVRRWVQSGGSPNGNSLVKLTNDNRITGIGHMLRRSSLDEIPQLWNVLKGDMTLVGPRPVPLYEIAEYEPWHKARLKATPGITGLWQIRGRGQVSVDEMVRLDLEYLENQSILLDFKIMFLTIPAVLTRRGAA